MTHLTALTSVCRAHDVPACRRLQALARDGLCWQRPAYQRPASSSTCRSFWDLSAVQQQQQQAEVEAA